MIYLNKRNIALLFLIPLSLSSCNAKSVYDFSIVCPSGAPTLAIYETLIENSGAVIETDATRIPGYIKYGSRFDYIVFDAINGLKITNNLKQGDYTFVKLLTGGNFHLAGFNTNSQPKIGDKIVCFGENLVPDLAIKTCFPELFNSTNLENISYVNAVTDVVPILKSGKYQGSDINYCFIAQPALFNVMNSNNNDQNTLNDVYDICNLNGKIKEITNNEFDYIPQAGLFVNDSYLKENEEKVHEFLENVDNQIRNASSGKQVVINKINEYSNDLGEQSSFFGFNVNSILNLQKDGANQFGLITKNISISDINRFLNIINSGVQIEEK